MAAVDDEDVLMLSVPLTRFEISEARSRVRIQDVEQNQNIFVSFFFISNHSYGISDNIFALHKKEQEQ